MLGYDNLSNFYKTNFSLVQFHKYSLAELENMIPWERTLFIDMITSHVKVENERRREQEAALRVKR